MTWSACFKIERSRIQVLCMPSANFENEVIISVLSFYRLKSSRLKRIRQIGCLRPPSAGVEQNKHQR